VFIGDVRSLRHLEVFDTAVEIARSEGASTIADVQSRVRRRAADEGELVVDPELFESVARELGDASVERAELKPGRAQNEMTAFRYDVVLRKRGNGEQPESPAPHIVNCPEPCSVESLRALLREEPALLHIARIPNARLVHEVRAAELVASGNAGLSVADVLRASNSGIPALDPEDIRALDPRYEAVVEFSRERPDLMDVTLRHRTKVRRLTRVPAAAGLGPTAYANTPAQPEAGGAAVIPALREHVRRTLPEYMVPGAFVLMDALPLTPNGKVDRAALPAPERTRSESAAHQPPNNDVERAIVSVLHELLGASDIGVDDNFFDLGANSLMMVQASVRLRALLGRPVPLVRMFQHPTARALAGALGVGEPTIDSGIKQSQDRAQLRKAAMQRLRGGARTRG
jgi:acyl carrier protein